MIKIKHLVKSLAIISLLIATHIVDATPEAIVATFPMTANFFIQNPKNSEIYASTSNSILVIDTRTLKVTHAISLWGNPEGIAVSPDGTRLYVATSSAQQLAVIDLTSYKVISSIPLPDLPYDVVVGNNKRIYASIGGGPDNGIMQIDAQKGKFEKFFSTNDFTSDDSLLAISPDRKTLYYADQGISPATLAKFDISTDTPILKYTNPFGSLGSNGEDLFVTPKGDYVYFAVGSGNQIQGYDIAQIRTSDMTIQGSLLTGPYPHAITTSPDGKTAYTVAQYSETPGIEVWNTETQQELCQYSNNDSDSANQLIVDHSGSYLFAAFPDKVQVYSTGCLIKQK